MKHHLSWTAGWEVHREETKSVRDSSLSRTRDSGEAEAEELAGYPRGLLITWKGQVSI